MIHVVAQTTKAAAPLPWWQIIPWMIALTGIGIAIFAYRRNRHPLVKVLKCFGCIRQNAKYSQGEHLLEVDLLSVGADIHDLSVWLEAQYRPTKETDCPSIDFQFFDQDEKHPEPLKNGQGATFILSHEHFREFDAMRKVGTPRNKLQELPLKDVSIAIYASGKRVILKRIPSTKFRMYLQTFDA